MSLFNVQLVALFLLLAGTFLCGILPVLWFRCLKCFSGSSSNRVTSSLIFFGGGVLFATSLLHLLPEAREQLEKISPHASDDSSASSAANLGNSVLKKSGVLNVSFHESSASHNESENHHHEHSHNFAWPEFIAMCGFFATYLIEEIIRAVLKRRSAENRNNGDRIKFCSCAQRNTECSKTYKDLKLEKADLLAPDFEKRKRSSTWAGQMNKVESIGANAPPLPPPDLLRSSIISQPYPKYGAVDEGGTGLPMRLDGGITLVNRPVAALPQPDLPEIVVVPASPVSEPIQNTSISIGVLLTVAALSFHSIFEGFAVGFQSTVMGTWTLTFAIGLHKFVIAFVIGVEAVVEENATSLILACMAVFASMSPIGMAIAMSLNGSDSSISPFVVGTLNCIATGTLLYVTFFEILRRKCENLCSGQRFMATISGFMLMSVVQYATTMF